MQIHTLNLNFVVLESLDACWFLWQQIKTEKEDFGKQRKKQNDTISSSCFHSLAHFRKIIKNVFLDIYNMLNSGKSALIEV